MKRSTEELALMLLPLVTVVAGAAIMLDWEVSHRGRDMLLLFGLVAIPLLTALLVGGFRYYRAHPFVGLLTAFSLLLLFPHSQDGTANDVVQFVLGTASGLGGGGLTVAFLVLTLKEMRQARVGTFPDLEARDAATSSRSAATNSLTTSETWGIH